MAVVKRYVSSKGGVIQIEIYPKDPQYYAVWYMNFFTALRLDFATHARLEETERRLHLWDSQIAEIQDYGDYPLFAYEDTDGNTTVNTVFPKQCENLRQIKAKDVRPGIYLADQSLDFFIFWLGSDRVSINTRTLR